MYVPCIFLDSMHYLSVKCLQNLVFKIDSSSYLFLYWQCKPGNFWPRMRDQLLTEWHFFRSDEFNVILRVSFVHACMADFHLGHKRLACLPDIYYSPSTQGHRIRGCNKNQSPYFLKLAPGPWNSFLHFWDWCDVPDLPYHINIKLSTYTLICELSLASKDWWRW